MMCMGPGNEARDDVHGSGNEARDDVYRAWERG